MRALGPCAMRATKHWHRKQQRAPWESLDREQNSILTRMRGGECAQFFIDISAYAFGFSSLCKDVSKDWSCGRVPSKQTQTQNR